MKPTPTVTIDAFQFQPEQVRIRRGQSVIFINKDAAPHTVTPGKNAHFVATGIIKGGEQRTVLFESAGRREYRTILVTSILVCGVGWSWNSTATGI